MREHPGANQDGTDGATRSPDGVDTIALMPPVTPHRPRVGAGRSTVSGPLGLIAVAVLAAWLGAACSTAGGAAGPYPSSPASGSTDVATSAPATTEATTTTTTTPPLDVFDPDCVVQVATGESLSLIADRFDDDTVYPASISAENDLAGDVIHPGQLLDVCVDNGLDDRTGAERQPNAAIVAAETQANVQKQQQKLNELFAPYGMTPLTVDGVSGSVTRQRLCAARLALGLPVSTADMAAGSDEEQVLMASPSLLVPTSSAMNAERWALIDQTCQIMFVGAGPGRIQFIFPTSTGEPGYETRPQDQARVYRYDPAFDNGGWHDSTDFPVPEDNPLNGNMYKPLYFDGGQAIHGANNVPTSPQSKGCARLRIEHMDQLVEWLGLGGLTVPTGGGQANLVVNVQGAYVPPA
jgi:hypothetical protein